VLESDVDVYKVNVLFLLFVLLKNCLLSFDLFALIIVFIAGEVFKNSASFLNSMTEFFFSLTADIRSSHCLSCTGVRKDKRGHLLFENRNADPSVLLRKRQANANNNVVQERQKTGRKHKCVS
jgi:hypothetical protein